MVDQKWKWIADSIDCANDNSFSVEKIKLNWFNLKFVGKKRKNGDAYNKEISIKDGRWTMQSGKFG